MSSCKFRDAISAMLYVLRTHKKDIALGVFLFTLPFWLPPFGVGANAGTIITASSTIFAIVAGFFIADAMANYLRLQTLIATENAALVTIANNTKQVDERRSASVYQAIDEYMIAQLDSGTLNHFVETQSRVDRLGVSIRSLAVTPETSSLYDHILSMEESIITSRQEMALAAKKTLSTGHWITLLVFAALVAIAVLVMRDGTRFFNIVTGVMIVGTLAVLIVLRDIDNNRLLERKLAYENPREVFHAISRPPYYPRFSETKSRVPDEHGQLRLGDELRKT